MDGVERFIGKHILVGLTYEDHQGNVQSQQQIHGIIKRITEPEGIVIDQMNGDGEFTLPPALDSLSEAPDGEYRLRSTDEVVVNPDLLGQWTITAPDPEDSNSAS